LHDGWLGCRWQWATTVGGFLRSCQNDSIGLQFFSMPRSTPTKQQLNQAIRTDIPGGDFILDVFNYLHIVRRMQHTDECYGFLDFIYNRLKSIRARMREAVIDQQNGIPTDPTSACKAIADEVIQDLRSRLKNPRYCKRKKLKHDHNYLLPEISGRSYSVH